MSEILRNLTRRKLRSFLTIFGITIGVVALTTMGAMAENFNALIAGGVTYFGSNIQVGPPDGQLAQWLDLAKVDQIKKVQGVGAVFPGYGFPAKPGAAIAVSFGIPDTIVAGDPAERDWTALKTTPAEGRDLNEGDTGDVVLGSSIAAEFKKHPGDTLRLPVKPPHAKADFVSHEFKVIGVLKPTLTAPDSFAYISLADGQALLQDSLPPSLRQTIDVKKITQQITVYGTRGSTQQDLDRVADRINREVTGVKAMRPSELVNAFRSGGAIFTAITTAAALIALVIGGISVVNTMIMAVSERTREIGLKKAVGAKTRHILWEFLLEATLIGVVGGVAGFGIGWALATVLDSAGAASQQQLFLVTPTLAAVALGFALVLGVLAGIIPALRAARLDPVRALRSL